MRLYVSSYNNTSGEYNAAAEETGIISYRINHTFNKPAECEMILSDPSGSLFQKYNVDADDVYVGPGYINLEDPTGTSIYKGRLVLAEGNTDNRTLTLTARDWLDQLDDELLTYDMREDLDGSGLRQSTIYSDYDDADGQGIRPANKFTMEAAKMYNHDDTSYTDITGVMKSAAASDAGLLPTAGHGLQEEDAFYIGFYSAVTEVVINIGTAGEGTFSGDWEYWDGDSWESLSASDGTNDLHNSGVRTLGWTDPGDWAESAIDGDTCYWARWRCTDATSYDTQPLGTQAWTAYVVYDKSGILTQDAHIGQYFILTDEMAGLIEMWSGPYNEIVSVALDTTDSPAAGETYVWDDDGNVHEMEDADDVFVVDYYFRPLITTSSTWFSSLDSVYVDVVACDEDADIIVWIGNGAAGLERIGVIPVTGEDEFIVKSFQVPKSIMADVFEWDSEAGESLVRLQHTAAGGNMKVDMCRIRVKCNTTGYSSASLISDNETYRLTVAADFTAAATRIWDQAPYCVTEKIFKHIASDETPGNLITDGDALSSRVNGAGALVCAGTVEHTVGMSTRQFTDRTRLDVLQSLAQQDKAVFWCTLGGTTITYKSTFNASPAGEYALTDAKVIAWRPKYDWGAVYNEYDIYGMRIGDQQLHSNITDATSIAKYGATRQQTKRSPGLVSEYDTSAIGTALVNQTKDVQLMLGCTIPGNTATAAHSNTIKLGDELDITSTYLGLTNAKYIINSWSYDSRQNLTTLMLHPRVSTTGLSKQSDDYYNISRTGIPQTISRQGRDDYIAKPSSDVV